MIATQVSSPIRSASASGPIGCPKPSFATVSIASASATPSASARTASLRNGIRIRLAAKPATSRASTGSLPSSRASATIAAVVSLDVSPARITSTSFSTGTGLKKCMPITCAGRPVAAASVPIGIELVFEARIAWRGQRRVGAAEDVLLDRRVLDDGLDHQVGRDERRRRARCARAPRPGPGRPSRRAASRLRRIVSSARSVAPGNGSCSETRRPEAATHLGDPAAHLARADDEDVLEALITSVARRSISTSRW